MEPIIYGLVFGFATSFHCAGMCGPIALALPLHGNSRLEKLFGGVLYNLGRTLTYVLLGMAFGLLGQGIGALGFQQGLSIVTGLLMISTVAFPSLFSFRLNGGQAGKGHRLMQSLKSRLRALFSTRTRGSLFTIGFFNGFLPCGPLYSAIIIAAGLGSVSGSVIFMVLFGLGTIPMLLTITLLGNILSHPIRKKMAGFLPALIVIIGILFLLRGLNLGIPYLSPTEEKIRMKIEGTKKEQPMHEMDMKRREMPFGAGKQMECCGK